MIKPSKKCPNLKFEKRVLFKTKKIILIGWARCWPWREERAHDVSAGAAGEAGGDVPGGETEAHLVV